MLFSLIQPTFGFQPRQADKHHRRSDQKQHVYHQHHRNIPGEEQALQGADEITSGNNVRHRADHRGHTVDLENKAGKHNRRQEKPRSD
ncbi:hypothetical protein HMPREF9347_05516, partial [Escherichia coli MS 124-1]